MVGDGIDSLCLCEGWSYGVLWRPDRRDPRLLMLEESYYDEKRGNIFEKMTKHAHVIGKGTIGEVAVSGKHRWLNFDTRCMELSEISVGVNFCMLKEAEEWRYQILAGIKTIAVISMPSLGVILFGSTNKICENPNFVAQAQHFLCQFGNRDLGYNYIDWNFIHPPVTFSSCLGSSSINNNVWRHSVSQQRHDDQSSSEYSSLASGLLSTICQIDSRNLSCSLKPSVSCLPVASAPSVIFNGHHHLSYKFRNQRGTLIEDHFQLPLNSGGLPSNYKSVNHLFTSYCNSDTWTKENDQYAYTVHKPFDILCKNSTSLHSRVESQAIMLDDSSPLSNKSVPNLDSFQHYSSPFVPACSLATIKPSSKSSPYSTVPPSTQELENMTLAPSTSEPKTHHSHSKPIKNHIYSNKGLVTDALANSMTAESLNSPKLLIPSILEQDGNWNASTVHAPSQLVLDNDLFDGMELDLSSLILRQGIWDDLLPVSSNNFTKFSSSLSDCISELEMDSVSGDGKDFFSDSCLEELLDAVVSGNAYLCNSDSLKVNDIASQDSRHSSPAEYNNIKENNVSAWNNDKMIQGFLKDTRLDDSCSVINSREDSTLNQPMRMVKSAKAVRRKARPGESSRPRPKDRQQIQDRVKELRKIVPNGAKCSIDCLLDRTIRHMLFLQSVKKYASKLKQVDQPKIISEESGVVLRDNANGGFSGATWAYEVAGQTMVCPILVEDLHPFGQMLVEMLCEERGFFLEIADVVRGFGLTILKGIMENRGRKVWARFIVEANRDVTRMDIFLSLVELLQQTSNSILSCEPQARAGDASLSAYQQSSAAIPIGLVNGI